MFSRPVLVGSLCHRFLLSNYPDSVLFKKQIQYMLGNFVSWFIEDVHISDLLLMSDLSELVDTMEKNIQITLDSQAQLKKKQLPVRTRVPWYMNDLKQQKQTFRKRE